MVELTVSSDGLTINVETWDELQEWLDAEKAEWAWLHQVNPLPQSFITYINQQYADMNNSINNFRRRDSGIDSANNILNPFRSDLVFHHKSASGIRIHDIRDSFGDVAAIYAYAFDVGQVQMNSINRKDAFLGVMAVTQPSLQDAAVIEDRLQKERSNYRSSLDRANSKIDAWKAARDEEWAKFQASAKKLGISSLRRNKEQALEHLTDFTERSEEALTSFRETESTYRDFMGLRAPVDYWKAKANEHDRKRKIAAYAMVIYFGVLIFVLSIVFLCAGSFISDGKSHTSLYFLISAAIAVLSTVGFWGGRIVTKLYLSEHHLKIDADERAIMTQTYLSLKEAGDATDAERHLILTALFRPSHDGIVKDEGPSDISLQSMLARQMQK